MARLLSTRPWSHWADRQSHR